MIFYVLFTISVKSDRCLYDLFILPRCTFLHYTFPNADRIHKAFRTLITFKKSKMVCDLFFCSSVVPNDRLKL